MITIYLIHVVGTTTQTIRTGSNSPDQTQQKTLRHYSLSLTFGQGEIDSKKL